MLVNFIIYNSCRRRVQDWIFRNNDSMQIVNLNTASYAGQGWAHEPLAFTLLEPNTDLMFEVESLLVLR